MKNPSSPQGQRIYRYFDLVMASFVTVLIVSNIASSAKVIDWGVSILGTRLAFDAGTILFPVSYIFGDVLTEVYGYRKSRRVIWTGFVCLAISALVLMAVRFLPGDARWQSCADDALAWTGCSGQDAFIKVLGGMSSGGIVLASLVAFFAGEFSNSFILAKMKLLTHGRWLWTRTIGSTLVGELVDSVLFVVVATLTGVFPWSLFASLVLTNYIFKCGVEILMTPVTYRVVSFLKKAESEDYYDYNTNFSPFKMG